MGIVGIERARSGQLWVQFDVEPETATLDPRAVEKAMQPVVEAILAVDIFGVPSDTAALRRLADVYGVWYIADAAQSLGAWRDGRPASRLADAVVVSFTVGKPLDVREGGAVLTDSDQLYERLLWFTQHPGRQARELELHLANEFGLNARIHPLAAVWANAVFEDALLEVGARQKRGFELIDLLSTTGLIEPIGLHERGILPSFFRLTATWKRGPREGELCRIAANQGYRLQLTPSPVRLLYRQGAFVAQYGRSWQTAGCPIAESQARKRFCIVDIDPSREG